MTAPTPLPRPTTAPGCIPLRWAQREPSRQIQRISAAVAACCLVSPGILRGPCQSPAAVVPRQAAMWLIRRHTSLSLPQIGRAFLRHHTTVLHSVRAFERRLQWDGDALALVEIVEGSLGLRAEAPERKRIFAL